MAFDLSSLTAYVEENRGELLGKAILRGTTLDVIRHQPGVKGSAAINILDVDVTWRDGATCGFTAAGDDEFSQRNIETKMLELNKQWCYKDLVGYWTAEKMRNSIIAGDKVLTFEEFITNKIIEGVNASLETIAWQGKASNPAITGLLAQFTAASQTIQASTGSTALENIWEVYQAIPEAVVDKAVIFVDSAVFRAAVANLVAGNLYHFNPGVPVTEFVLPGTNCRVIKANGLNSATEQSKTSLIVGADPANLVYGYDVEDSPRTFDLWYERKDDAMDLRLLTNAGFQIAFPTEVVIYGQ